MVVLYIKPTFGTTYHISNLYPLCAINHPAQYALQTLQTIYNDACDTKAEIITIELPTFKKIDTMLQEAWDRAKTAQRTLEESIQDPAFVD